MSFLASQMERCAFLFIHPFDLRLVFEKQFDNGRVVVESCEMKRSLLLVRVRANIRSTLNQNLSRIEVSIGSSVMEG